MRIAFVTTMAGFPWGGSETVWSRAARLAAAEGHGVLAAVFDWSTGEPAVDDLRRAGVKILARPREVRRSVLQRALNRLPGVRALPRREPWLDELRRFAPDVVCVSSGIHYECVTEPALFEWLIGGGIPFAVVSNGNSERITFTDAIRAAERRFLGAARPLIFVSHGNRELAERQLAWSFENAVVIENSVDTIPSAPLPWPHGAPVFSIVGSLYVAFKGQDVLLRALSTGPWPSREWTCHCYGDGPDAGYLKELIALFGLESRVTLKGRAADVKDVWARSHVCVLPSRAEGTPLALLEALASGRPAVVTDVGGNAEWVEEGETGFVADAATPLSFGQALERAWAARDRWEVMGRTAWERSSKRLDPNPARTLLSVLESTARSRR